MATNFPGSLDNSTSLPNPTATNDTNSPSLAGGQDNQNSAIIAAETKIGTGSSNQTASANTVLLGDGTGTSHWGSITGAFMGSTTGTGAFVLATSPTISSATLTTPVINNPTLKTDSVVGFTSANSGTLYGMNVTSSLFTTNVIGAGLLVPNNLVASSGTGWAWQSFTPTWTNLTTGNGTTVARYGQIGKLVVFEIEFTLGSTSAVTGAISATLPITARSGVSQSVLTIANGLHGTTFYPLICPAQTTTSTGTIAAINASSTYAQSALGDLTSATVPFTWGTNDILLIQGIYEAA